MVGGDNNRLVLIRCDDQQRRQKRRTTTQFRCLLTTRGGFCSLRRCCQHGDETHKVINERDILGTQLIRRNDELALLYEKLKIQQSTLKKVDRVDQKAFGEASGRGLGL